MTAREVEAAYRRAEQLVRLVGESSQQFPIRWGQWVFHFSAAEHRVALKVGKELLVSAKKLSDPDLIFQAHHASWTSSFATGNFTAAHEHCERGLAIYQPERHHAQFYTYGGHDAGVCCLSFAGPVQWMLGYGDQALDSAQKALDLSKEFTHPASIAQPLYWIGVLHQLRLNAGAVREYALAARRVIRKQDLPFWYGWDSCLLGWADAVQGKPAAGIEQIQHGLDAMQARRGRLLISDFLTLLAEAYCLSGQCNRAAQTLDAALAEIERTDERWWAAEVHRARGDLLLRQGADDEAEEAYHRAIKIAQRQKAKSLELRATMALCRLWRGQGKAEQAYQWLSELYGWFSEGFDTHDLCAARELLDQLS